MDCVTKRALDTNLSEKFHCRLSQFYILLLASDIEDLCDFRLGVWFGGDYKGSIEKIDW